MKYENQSNLDSTNIFETFTGATNIAPLKISGQYKIVYSIDGNLYFDDYTGRRTLIDKSKPFLPQVATFLSTETTISDTNLIKYGGFQKSNVKSFHIPLYLNEKNYPKYYVLSRVINETITNIDFLYKYGKLEQVIDLEKIGLYKIFDEIANEKYFDYPLFFNWEDHFIKLFGYSIDNKSKVFKQLNLIDSQANQPNLEVLNNKILNTFVKEKIIFPRFINIEIEFFKQSNKILFLKKRQRMRTYNEIEFFA